MKNGMLSGVGLLVAICAGWAAAGETDSAVDQAADRNRPNVLWIAIDDLNDWVGCLQGHPQVKTPNLDRLAARGTLFTNAHCQAPLCGPSRASVMTGLLPSTTGIYGQIYDGPLQEEIAESGSAVFLHQYLSQQGYTTLAVGKLLHVHLPHNTVDLSGGRIRGAGPKPAQRFHWDHPDTGTDWAAYPEQDRQLPDWTHAQWAVDQLGQPHQEPFFLGVGFNLPHVPWYVPQKWFDRYAGLEIETPPYLPSDLEDLPELALRLTAVPMMPTTAWAREQKQWRNIVHAYLACVTFVDAQVGRVLDALEASPYAENTIVVLWSDHGYHLGEKNRFAKHSLWERATRVPLIIAGSGLPAGQVCPRPVQLLDLYPTLLDLCQLPPNSQNEGHSLKPLLEQPNRSWPHAALTTYGRNNHAVRDDHFRYIRYEDGSEELYDHRTDPHEWHNLAADPRHAETKRRLQHHLPSNNARWSRRSRYDINTFFIEQRKRAGR